MMIYMTLMDPSSLWRAVSCCFFKVTCGDSLLPFGQFVYDAVRLEPQVRAIWEEALDHRWTVPGSSVAQSLDAVLAQKPTNLLCHCYSYSRLIEI